MLILPLENSRGKRRLVAVLVAIRFCFFHFGFHALLCDGVPPMCRNRHRSNSFLNGLSINFS